MRSAKVEQTFADFFLFDFCAFALCRLGTQNVDENLNKSRERGDRKLNYITITALSPPPHWDNLCAMNIKLAQIRF